jgi:hypothetical protein
MSIASVKPPTETLEGLTLGHATQVNLNLISLERSPVSGVLEIVILSILSGQETWVPISNAESPLSIKDYGLSVWAQLQVANSSSKKRYAPDQFSTMRNMQANGHARSYARIDNNEIKEGTPLLEWCHGCEPVPLFSGKTMTCDPKRTGWKLTLAHVGDPFTRGYWTSIELGFARWNDPQALSNLIEMMDDTESLMITTALLYPEPMRKTVLRQELVATEKASREILDTKMAEMYQIFVGAGLIKSGKTRPAWQGNKSRISKYPGSLTLVAHRVNNKAIPFGVEIVSGIDELIIENDNWAYKMKQRSIFAISQKLCTWVDRIACKRKVRLQKDLTEWLSRMREAIATLPYWRLIDDPDYASKERPIATSFSEEAWAKFASILVSPHSVATHDGARDYHFIPSKLGKL